MIKTLCRFCLLLGLCSLFVYAPEILHAASAPYALPTPERTLLRVALCCDNKTSSLANKAITAYQKDHPTVHLRITGVDTQQLSRLHPSYLDVILCSQHDAAQLPPDFSPAAGNSTWLCVIPPNCASPAASLEFAAYIDRSIAFSKRTFSNLTCLTSSIRVQ